MVLQLENLSKLHRKQENNRVSFREHILTHSDQNIHDDCPDCSEFRRIIANTGTEIKSVNNYIETHTN